MLNIIFIYEKNAGLFICANLISLLPPEKKTPPTVYGTLGPLSYLYNDLK